MTLKEKAHQLYEAQYRSVDQSSPGGWLTYNICTDIGAVVFPLTLPGIKIHTYFLGHHTGFMKSPFQHVEDNVFHTYYMSCMYCNMIPIRAAFAIAKDILFKLIHSSHDN